MAEHSFLVSILAIDISRRVKFSNHRGGPINIEKEHQIMRWAMWHDLPEIVTGDLPTPTKATLRQLAGFDISERAAEMVSNEYTKIKAETFEPVKDIVKMADILESIEFLKVEGKGKHASEVLSGLIKQLGDHYQLCKRKNGSLKWDEVRHMVEFA